ncbi:decaprenyl-phosphate phosphoribosyltransferase [Psychrobacter aquimaris]|uniref:decaprenyl-phosphate phosphoribosyltransferase n=1 Tax=Psychrobacter aquimaris TaxID=292733 RepID=UPI0039C5DCC1
MNDVIRLLRPHQYIKNNFVFLGPLFGHQWSVLTLTQATLTFIAFCFMASAVYILNDLMDIDADKKHPIKCSRPLPSGTVSLPSANFLLAVLIIAAVVTSYLVSFLVTLFVSAYFLMNVLYSWKLKHVVILDVFIISAGFMLRILTGTVGLSIEPTAWLLLCGLMVTLFLGFSKRRAELLVFQNCNTNSYLTRRVLDDYSPILLEQFIGITAACTILSFGLYTVSPQTIALHGTDNLIYTLPFVIYGVFRYIFLLHHKAKGNDTAKDLITDRHLLIAVALWLTTTIWILL